jgi:hypothetical protein
MMMDRIEAEYQDPVKLDMLRTYGPIMHHVLSGTVRARPQISR